MTMLEQLKIYTKKIAGLSSGPADLFGMSSKDRDMLARIQSSNLTYLTRARLVSLSRTCRSIVQAKLPGIFLEAGCALGGSTILMASIKESKRPLFVYDVFGMIPAPTQEDTPDVHDRYKTIADGKSIGINGDKYYGYQENLLEVVRANLKRFGISCENQSVSLIKGPVQETVRIEESVAFAHIDVDWYEPVLTCLNRIFPRLIVGGSLILDDYHDWGGCRKAADEYLMEISDQCICDDSAGSMKITRVRN
jgi:hypothetical protein